MEAVQTLTRNQDIELVLLHPHHPHHPTRTMTSKTEEVVSWSKDIRFSSLTVVQPRPSSAICF